MKTGSGSVKNTVVVGRATRKSIMGGNLGISHFSDSGQAGFAAGVIWFSGGKDSELTKSRRIVKRTLLFQKRTPRFLQHNFP